MKHPLITAAILLLSATNVVAAGMPVPANPDPTIVQGGAYNFETTHTRVQFAVSHFGYNDWYGDFTGVTGSLNLDPKNVAASKLDVTLPVASISTTNATLDQSLKGAPWLDAGQYPTIHFVSNKIVQTAANKATVTGDLTFHGVTKPVTLSVVFNGAGVNPLTKHYTVGFSATGAIKRSDFGVTNYLPIIGDETTLRISAALERSGN